MIAFSSVASFYNVCMKQVLPIIIICAVGIAASLAYIIYLCVNTLRSRPHGSKRVTQFEIDDDVLTIKLGKRKKRK